ncbi:hypothetical protein [Marimonas lutisalis]|uniref:hypothetical protein n=1 Tax=Marimonas lutisalis TaxID=2545756 RepID=UPI0010FA4D87|nr:hypothetical protein [Marimonas lutisalis]
MAVAGCSDPLRQVPKLSEVEVDAPAPVVEAVAAPVETDENAGLFQRLLRNREVGAATYEAAAEAPDTTAQEAAADEAAEDGIAVASAESAAAPEQRGFLGRLFSRDKAETVTGDAPEQVERVALVKPEGSGDDAGEQARPEPKDSGGFSGLFGSRKAARLTGPDAREAAPGEVLPFGEIARACHVKRGELGREVGHFPEKRPKYRVYDSNPADAGLNTFYITGFGDGCPRQLTAALAVFGSPGMYEALRYGLPESARTGKATDKAYEKVKSQVCGVRRNKPCGAKIDRMERNTVFVSVYNRFEGANGWINILIHDGEMLAMAPGG